MSVRKGLAFHVQLSFYFRVLVDSLFSLNPMVCWFLRLLIEVGAFYGRGSCFFEPFVALLPFFTFLFVLLFLSSFLPRFKVPSPI